MSDVGINQTAVKMFASHVLVICVCLLFSTVVSLTTRKVRVNYPTELLHPKTGSSFAANVSQDKLVCFGNDDYNAPTYRETLFCMLPYLPGTSSYCYSVWGSRTVEVEVAGSIEFLKVAKLPHETTSTKNISPHKEYLLDNAYSLELSTTRWLEMHSVDPRTTIKKTIQIPAEPIYLCARSTDWQGRNTAFSIKFRPAYLRVKDKRQSHTQTLVHIMLIVAVSFVWFVPYFAALVAAVLVYEHGIKIMLTLFMFSTCLVCLTPLMFTKHNRQSARVYFNYFFTRIQAAQMRQHIIKRLPVFQALFFSSLLIFCGFGAVYGAYYYDFMEREFRNSCLKTILSVAISWFVFSLCRSFERFFTSWLWILMCMTLAHILDPHLNPTCRTEVVVATMIISQVVRLIVPHVVQFRFINTIISSALPRLECVSSKFRIPLPYQIYEHHSLQHLIYIRADSANTLHAITHTSMDPLNSPLLNLTHTSTSTADLDHFYHNNSRPNTSRKSSFASIHEIQPLVDYLDEVLEGREHDQGYGELGLLADLDKGIQDYEEDEQMNVEGELSDANHSAGELLYLMGVTENADSEVQNSGNTPSSTNYATCTASCRVNPTGKLGVPLHERLQADEVPLKSLMDSTESTEELNRAALFQHANVSTEEIPQYSQFTAASVKNTTPATTITAIKDTNLSTTTSTGSVTRSGRGKSKALVVPPSHGTVPRDAHAEPTDTHSATVVSAEVFPQLIGATVVPLSLIGPVNIKHSQGHTERNRNNDNANADDDSNHWYPLATHDSALVNRAEGVCSSLVNAVECTLLPPLQDTLTLTSRLHANDAGAGRPWLQWPVQYLTHLLQSAIQAEPVATLFIAALRAKHTVHRHDMFRIQCIPQGSSAVLQLSVSTDVLCNVSTLVTVGKALLKRILQALQADHTSLKCGRVLVDYAPLSSPSALLPFTHYTSVALTLSVPAGITMETLVAAHGDADKYEANAFIQSVLRALCTAIGVDLKYTDSRDDWVTDVEFINSGNNIRISARVPVILTQLELNINAAAAIGANKCRELLLGTNSYKHASAINNSASAFVLCSYIAFLQNM